MRTGMKKLFTILIVTVMMTGLISGSPVSASENSILTLSASYSSGRVLVNGTTSRDVLAVAVMLYDTDGTTLLRMESFGVEDQSFTASMEITLPTGNYTVKAADYSGGPFESATFTRASSGGSSSGDSSGSTTPPVSTYTAELQDNTNQGASLPVTVNTSSATGSIQLEQKTAEELFSASGMITLPAIPNVHAYKVGLPAACLSDARGEERLRLETPAASMVIPDSMLSMLPMAEGVNAEITIGEGDKSTLTAEEQVAVGNRPLIQMSLSVNGEKLEWNNPDAPVTLSIPYTPSADELSNPESIVIWYLDGSGELILISNGRYDPDLGVVTFSTTHFSLYAVGYNNVTFRDVASGAWYHKAISFIAARKITSGTGNGNYGPGNHLTRGEFIVMLMRTYGIAPDTNPTDNFADAENAYYTNYLAAAKRLGISAGIGNNLFGIDLNITRQEMLTMTYKALKVINGLPEGSGGKPLSGFSDGDSIDSYAREAMALFAETGIIGVGSDKLYPTLTTTRAEMAQVLYNLTGR